MAPKSIISALESLANEEPRSMAARVRRMMALIEANLEAGHSLCAIHKRLQEAGVEITYKTLSKYRRRFSGGRASQSRKSVSTCSNQVSSSAVVCSDGFDPAANYRAQIRKRIDFEYPSGPPDESKLV